MIRRAGCRGWGMLAGAGILLLVSCELNREYRPRSLPEVIEEFRKAHHPDRRLAVFSVRMSGDHGDWTLTGEMSSSESHQALLDTLKKEFPEATIHDKIVVLPAAEVGSETQGVVKISVASQYREAKYSAELVNQALMGTELRLLKKKEGWYYVQLPDGYLGWMPGNCLQHLDEAGMNAWRGKPKIVVDKWFDIVRAAPRLAAATVSDVTLGVRLAKIQEGQGWLEVELPDGRSGFLEAAGVRSEESLRSVMPTAQGLEATALEMLGFPYLWGGTSAKGMDCSGFTLSVFRRNNLTLPRDADMQSQAGQPVELDAEYGKLEKGDLLFFGPGQEKITHVGMYLEAGKYIHSSGLVRINSLRKDDPSYDEERVQTLRKARRFLR